MKRVAAAAGLAGLMLAGLVLAAWPAVPLAAQAQAAKPTAPAQAAAATAPAAIAALRHRAIAGDLQAQYDLAIVLLCGQWVPRDPAQASLWLALASARDHRGSQSVLGWLLMTGTGARRDDAHAAHWLGKAAEGGDTAAQNNLGVLYATGRGVKQDEAQADRWFSAAAEKGATEAARNLAVLRGEASAPTGRRRAVALAVHPALAGAACRMLPPTLKNSP
ncbi:MAG: tetratricopeptide repeat protein [Rubrivivax sp.]|nr:tetratricopeptide repeat protein [Rubrivivax sp.]